VSALSDQAVDLPPYREIVPSNSSSHFLAKPPQPKQYRWNRDKYSHKRRFLDIWAFVGTLMTGLWLDSKPWSYQGGMTEEKKVIRRKKQAVWIRETLLNLGPTFIKVGQLFSTRADLFPSEYVDELIKLQDQVPAFGYEQAAVIIAQDLGKPVEKLFNNFDPIPLAAASLGQVHRAELVTGESVVVKVQRPGLKQLFAIDLDILRGIAKYFQRHPSWGRNRDWMGIYDECCRILWEEIDYLSEGANADTFRRNFRADDWVKVPRVYWRYASPRVLTLEYLPGIKISHYEALENAGLDRKLLAQLGAKAYLQQLLNDGFFHADPHPGNIAVDLDGALIFYDFGMMGRIKANVREQLMETLFGIAQKDADRVVTSLVALGALSPMEDVAPVRRSIQYMLDYFMDKPFENQSVSQISDDLYEIAYDQPFRFPATFTFVMRAFSTLEGVGKGLDPDFNFMEAAKPFAMDIMNGNGTETNSFISEIGRQAAQMSNTALGLPRRIEDTMDKLDRGDLKVRVKAAESDRLLRKINSMQLTTNYTILVGAFTVSATILFVSDKVTMAVLTLGLAIVSGIFLVRLLQKIDRFERKM